MKKAAASLAFACVLVSAGCSRDDEVKNAVTALDSFTQELVQAVKSGSTPAAGVAAARKHFDANQKDVAAKVKAIMNVRGFQLGSDTKKLMEEHFTKDVMAVESLKIDLMMATMNDKDLEANLNGMIADYERLAKGE
jgi:hypothetical protein